MSVVQTAPPPVTVKVLGSGFTMIVLIAVAEQLLAFVTVTVYVVVVAGLTVIAAVVAPVLQAYVPPPVPVNVAEVPEQMIPSLLVVPEVSATVIPAVGKGFTVIVVVELAVQPAALVTVTV